MVRPVTKRDVLRAFGYKLKPIFVFVVIALPISVQAAPSDMGSITVTSSNSSGNASGIYTTSAGDKGSFTLTRNATTGYNNTVDILGGTNGIEITNNANSAIHNDSFTYTFTITPDNNNAIHSIKIGQASYTEGGNSEVARHTLSNVTQNSAINIPSRLYVKDNPSVDFYYEAMGDYFMGRREGSTNVFSYEVGTSEPQVRSNSSNNLYFFKINELAGSNLGGNNRRQLSTTDNEVRFASSSSRGVLPNTPTFANILKSTSSDQNTFTAYSNNQTINGNSYVTYGIENSRSDYVVAARNVVSLTLNYRAIMNGSNAFVGNVVGETFNEWISFGVESEPVYVFSGTVFNDNGGINDNDARTDTIGGIYDNNRYFNGVFNPTPTSSPELGISGSTVRLVDSCSNPTVEYASTTTNSTGNYKFTLLQERLNGVTSVCIIETSNNSTYSIRTTTDKRAVSLTDDTFTFTKNDFGRVVEANKALVLEKEQAVNDCTITTLLPSAQNNLNYSKGELTGIDPGQCIAYKITATNRANLSISEFVMQDKLQEAGVGNATVSSVLTLPVYNTKEYAEDSVAIGNNDVPVKTKALPIAPRTQKVFYFNTKYGNSQSNP